MKTSSVLTTKSGFFDPSLSRTTESLGFSFLESEIPISLDAVNAKIAEDRELDKLSGFDDSVIVEQLKDKLWMYDERGQLSDDNAHSAQRFLLMLDDLINYEIAKYAQGNGSNAVFGADDRIPLIIKCFIRAYCGSQRFNAEVFDILEPSIMKEDGDMISQQRFLTLRACAGAAREWLLKRRFFPKFREVTSSANEIPPLSAKIIVVGPSEAGKTSVMVRYFRGKFDTYKPSTIGVDYFNSKIKLSSGVVVSVTIWDTAGQERFQSIARNLVRDTDGVFFVYSSVAEVREAPAAPRTHYRPVTYPEVMGPNGFYERNVQALFEDKEALRNMPTIVFGNKSDLLPDVSQAAMPTEAEKFIFLGSAKTGENVQRAFSELVYMVAIRKYHEYIRASTSVNPSTTAAGNRNSVDLSKPSEAQNGKTWRQKCCGTR